MQTDVSLLTTFTFSDRTFYAMHMYRQWHIIFSVCLSVCECDNLLMLAVPLSKSLSLSLCSFSLSHPPACAKQQTSIHFENKERNSQWILMVWLTIFYNCPVTSLDFKRCSVKMKMWVDVIRPWNSLISWSLWQVGTGFIFLWFRFSKKKKRSCEE